MYTIDTYLSELLETIGASDGAQLQKAADAIEKAWKEGRHIFLFGNGGSAATAAHAAVDLQKGLTETCGIPCRAVSLTTELPIITAWANDESYESVFLRPLSVLMEPGDVVIGISGSGNSPNVLRAIEHANEKGGVTIGLAGYGGGKLASLARIPVVTQSRNMQMCEDLHTLWLHAIYSALRDAERKP
jgi:D-sedoheptulose 7-phosphate isomerase